MTERHLHSDPPSPAEVAAATADIDDAIALVATNVPVRQANMLVGLAGSVTTVAGIALGLEHYDSTRIHHLRLSARRAPNGQPSGHPGRVDVIGAGALVLDRIMVWLGFAEVLGQ